MNDTIRMQISAFVDGELPDNESELLLRRMCQDGDLRQQAAEYFAIGRAMRGQRGVLGIDKLRDRIAAVIDDKAFADEFDAIEPRGRRYLRPVAGSVIAATVALAAILGLQQMVSVDTERPPEALVTDGAAAGGYVVPPTVRSDLRRAAEDALQVYRAIHSSGASNIDARLTPLQRRENALDETGGDESGADPEADTAAPGR